jgi:hypothetical protein
MKVNAGSVLVNAHPIVGVEFFNPTKYASWFPVALHFQLKVK